jgi:hypothetical protein
MQELEQSDLETAEKVRDFVSSVPSGLDPLYSRLLGEANNKTTSFLSDTLRWRLVAQRPLTIRELSGALGQQSSESLTAENILRGQLRQFRGFLQTVDGRHVSYLQRPHVTNLHACYREPPQKSLMIALNNDEEARKTQCELTRDDSTTHDIEFE